MSCGKCLGSRRLCNRIFGGVSFRYPRRDRASGFAKDYLRALVDEIRVEGNAATISGSYERLIAAVVTMTMLLVQLYNKR